MAAERAAGKKAGGICLNTTIQPGKRWGNVKIPASKSQAHRFLICAALGEKEVTISCDGISKDIAATMGCLNALGANIIECAPGELKVTPIGKVPEDICVLPCGESGSTLRFLIPVVGALGAKAVFCMEGRLSQRQQYGKHITYLSRTLKNTNG